MSEDGTFQVDPDVLRAGTAGLGELGSYLWTVVAEFEAAMADTEWCGDDENGWKIKQNYAENRDAIAATLKALGEVTERTCDATLMNLGATSTTQQDILDGIDGEIGNYGTGGPGPGGGRRD
ncbi:hypothetical protein [Streptomyces sp. NPDC049916]|uniref:hypothetical protein n=1 Tax=Streptomyces sp. NPDC049916 TaxID=3155156 RepID=UPI00341C30FB